MADASARDQLATALRTARRLSGMDQRALAAAVGISQSTVSNVENGKAMLDRGHVSAWLRSTKAPPADRDQALRLLAAAFGEVRTWAELEAGREHLQDEAMHRTVDAELVQHWQSTIIPGILQTADYARVAIELLDVDHSINRDAQLAGRLALQGMLREPGRRFEFILAEELLTVAPEPGLVVAQLAHLLSAASLDAVDLAVLPRTWRGIKPGHNFVIREPVDGGPAYVESELVHGEVRVTKPDRVALYHRRWAALADGAVHGDDALALIRRELSART